MYWAITTLTGTGYGDIVPVNTSERIIATIAFVLGSSLFGYVTANVTEVVASFSKAEQVTNLSMAKMNEYLIKFKIQRGLRMDVVDHSRQVMKYRSVFDSRFILTRLPPHIRVAILAHQNIDVIKVRFAPTPPFYRTWPSRPFHSSPRYGLLSPTSAGCNRRAAHTFVPLHTQPVYPRPPPRRDEAPVRHRRPCPLHRGRCGPGPPPRGATMAPAPTRPPTLHTPHTPHTQGEPCVKLRFLISGKAIILRRKPDPRKPFTHTPVARKAPEFGIYNERLGHSGRVVEMDEVL